MPLDLANGPKISMETEPERCEGCGHFDTKHKNGLCFGVYWERTDNGAADIAVGCKCRKYEP